MFSTEADSSNSSATIHLDGALTVHCAGELKKVLQDALDRADHVTGSFRDVTEVDVSCLQLLCSAHRTAVSRGKIFALDGKGTEALRHAVHEAGYARHTGCSNDCNNSCLWTGGEFNGKDHNDS